MSTTTMGLAFGAGILSTLSPCVLPLLPIVVGSAANAHRFGPLALAGGLAVSFVTVGMFIATIGFAAGLDGEVFRTGSAVLMVLFGLALVTPVFQERLALAAGPVANWASGRMETVNRDGWSGQFLVGVLLGAVWSPCVGPTLGAASALAAQGESLGTAALTMLVFAFGAALPLLLIGLLSREAVLRIRGRLSQTGGQLKYVLGGILILVGLMVISGFDKVLETTLVAWSPAWLTALTTRY